MTNPLLLVGLGGALGSMARYGCQRAWNLSFPYGTITVNLIGCFLIGVLGGWCSRQTDEPRALLLMTGFCGGFTTFSSFTWESLQMLREGRWPTVAVYLAVSLAGGILLTFFGFKCTG